MKKHSLILKELLTDGFMGTGYVIIGIIGLFAPISLPTVILMYTVLAAEIIAIIMHLKNKFDVWDETAKEHYMSARRLTLGLLVLVLQILIILFLCLQISVSINVYHIMIATGLVQILLTGSFIYFEKRDK